MDLKRAKERRFGDGKEPVVTHDNFVETVDIRRISEQERLQSMFPCEIDGKYHLLEGAEHLKEDNLRVQLCEIQCSCESPIVIYRDTELNLYFVNSAIAAETFGHTMPYTRDTVEGLTPLDWCLEEKEV